MSIFKKLQFLIVVIMILWVFPVFAQDGMPHAHFDFLPEKYWLHIGLMFILFIAVIVSLMLSWNCSMLFAGRLGKSFEFISIGLGILVLMEIFNILNHLGLVITESSIDHIVNVLAFGFISFGFYSIIKEKENSKN